MSKKQMKIHTIAATGMILGSMIMADIPLLPLELVPDAQAIFGVRRRTAVVDYSARAASQQQATPTPQPAAPAPSLTAVPLGSEGTKISSKKVEQYYFQPNRDHPYQMDG